MVSQGSYEVVGHSDAPPEKVFDILADAAGWSRWAGPMIVKSWWEREGTPPPGGVGAIRGFGLKGLGSREEILVYEPPTHHAYRILSGLPVSAYRADVRLKPDKGGTRIEWSGTFTPKYSWAGPALQLFLRSTIRSFVRRLSKFAETG